VDEGKLTLDEPASKWLPELAKVKVRGERPLFRPITLRDLLSHTSGIADPPRKPSDGNVPIAQYALDLLKEPFEFQPGSKFEYGFGLTVAGRIVEIVSGKSALIGRPSQQDLQLLQGPSPLMPVADLVAVQHDSQAVFQRILFNFERR